MESRKIVAIGASAGGVDALMSLVGEFPPDFPAPILIVIHMPPDSPSLLGEILTRNGVLPARTAIDGETARDGRIYVAPPDYHLLIERDFRLKMVRGPRENRHRPAVDPLFRSAALAAGPDAIGVILTGSLDDGTAGLIAIKNQGGIAVVQDPQEAVYPSMPQSAIEHVDVDYVVPLSKIAQQLVTLVNQPSRGPVSVNAETNLIDAEKRIAEMEPMTLKDDNRPGQPSAFSCPDCGGVLWEIEDGELERYRCRVGHAFSPEALNGAQADTLEEALWTALKTLEESARLSRRLADAEAERGHEWMVKRFKERENDARQRAEVIRRFLLSQPSGVPVETAAKSV